MRQADRDELEAIILSHMIDRGPGWVTSREVATEIGFPWRVVARAMLCMVELERTETHWVSARCRKRRCNTFRFIAAPTATYPSWLMPQAHHVPEGIGYVNRMDG